MLPCGGAEIVIVHLDNGIIEDHSGVTVGDEHQNEGATGSLDLEALGLCRCQLGTVYVWTLILERFELPS